MRINIPIICLTLFCLSSCKNDNLLTREKATEAIKSMNFGFSTLQIPKGGSSSGGFSYLNELQEMQKEELLTYQIYSRAGEANPSITVEDLEVTLTPLGSMSLVSSDDKHYTVKTNDWAFDKVTGIRQEAENKSSAIVDYTLKMTNESRFKRWERNKSQSFIEKQAHFTKYDDGWRLDN